MKKLTSVRSTLQIFEGRASMLRRPLEKLHRIKFETHQDEAPPTDAPVVTSDGADVKQRPMRAAACRADSNGSLLIEIQTL